MTARTRTTVSTAGLVVAVLGTALAASAQPAVAGGKYAVTTYGVDWSFTGGVAASLGATTSYAVLDDYADAAYDDRVRAKPDNGDRVTVGGTTCRPGNYSESAVTLHGQHKNWFDLSATAPQAARVAIRCLQDDGKVHVYQWGFTATPNCVVLSRSGSVFSVSATGCQVEESIISNSGKLIGQGSPRPLSFTGQITLRA